MIGRLALIALSWSVVACSALVAPDRFPDGPAPVHGTIVDRDQPISIARTGPTMFVKGDATDSCGVVFAITDRTDIRLRTAENRLEHRGVDDLVIGSEVNVWTEIVMDSCPQQAHADAIEIL